MPPFQSFCIQRMKQKTFIRPIDDKFDQNKEQDEQNTHTHTHTRQILNNIFKKFDHSEQFFNSEFSDMCILQILVKKKTKQNKTKKTWYIFP